ncbi:hypothetical protein FACS1894159_04020 [Bacteroidia bacterium]|nr:hypothetical protein FACS1894159_04020 [Bacteroidia bacterium]
MLGVDAFRRKPRRFEYTPRYWDPRAEARELRRHTLPNEAKQTGQTGCPDAAVRQRAKVEEYRPGQYIRLSMLARRGMGDGQARQDKYRVRYRRLIVCLVALTALTVLLLQSI